MITELFIFVGLIMRYIYYILKDEYDMTYFKTKLWKSISISLMFSGVLYWVTQYAQLSVLIPTDPLPIASYTLGLIAVGWGIDSFFLSVLKLYSQNAEKRGVKVDI